MGFEAVHINNILDGSTTKDNDICRYADKFDYIVITKDSDFRDSFFARQTPKKLIKVNLGNISNKKLIGLFEDNLNKISHYSSKNNFLIVISLSGISLIEL